MQDIMRRTFKTDDGDTFDDVEREARAYLEEIPAVFNVDVEIIVTFPAKLNQRETLPKDARRAGRTSKKQNSARHAPRIR